MSNEGAWTPWYQGATESRPYLIDGDDLSYRIGARLLDGLHVCDWGCGLGWMRTYVPADHYTGIDGTASPFADIVADLAEFIRPTEGLFMRHVLEHDERWETILDNALESVLTRMVLVVYTPMAERTHVVLVEPTLKVVEQSFALSDLTAHMAGMQVDVQPLGQETLFVIDK